MLTLLALFISLEPSCLLRRIIHEPPSILFTIMSYNEFDSQTDVLAVFKDLTVKKVENRKQAFEMKALFAVESINSIHRFSSDITDSDHRFVEHYISVYDSRGLAKNHVFYKDWKLTFSTSWDSSQLTKERVFGVVTDPSGETGTNYYFGNYTDGIEKALAYLKDITDYKSIEEYQSIKKIEVLKTKMQGIQVDSMKGGAARNLLKDIIRIIQK